MRIATSRNLARVGDVDRDGADDFVFTVFTSGRVGTVLLISGRSGSILRQVFGTASDWGHALAPCGDMDLDGVPDFLVGSDAGPGYVAAISGRTGNALHGWVEPNVGSFFGYTIASDGIDLDRDGVPDVLVGAPNESNAGAGDGALYAFSGRTGAQLLHMKTDTRYKSGLGEWITPLRPETFGGFPAFLANQGTYEFLPNQNPPVRGRVSLWRLPPPDVAIHGPGCRGTLAEAPLTGFANRGAAGFDLLLSRAQPSPTAVLLLGVSGTSWNNIPLPIDVSLFGLPGCSLHVSVDWTLPFAVPPSGHLSLRVPTPLAGGGPGGLRLFAQWLALDPGQPLGALADAIRWQYR
jgi:hypothetical protein